MMKDKKKIAALIIAKAKPEGEMMPDMPEASPLEAAAEEIMSAMESKDAAMLTEALKAFVEMCADYKDEE